jgi:hypothetical protein
MNNIERKEQMFELFIDDLRYLGASIPYLHWDVNNEGNIYLLWDRINDDVENKHQAYSEFYQAKLNEFVNYFNLTHHL